MSIPISQCDELKAVIDDEWFRKYLTDQKLNHLNGGHYTVFPCNCTPSCAKKYAITQEIINNYNEKLLREWNTFLNSDEHKNCKSCVTTNEWGISSISKYL